MNSFLDVTLRVNESLKHGSTVVVTAPPGAGKSTLLPLSVLDGLNPSGKIIMLEPRRLAARQVAHRMAFLRGEPVGETVGYRIRFENKVSARTRIEVITEGILSRMLLEDPALDGVSVVIFDEFHERSLTSDESLAMTLESQRLIRPDLRIIVMSATIDTASICEALGAGQVCGSGRSFPVDIVYSEKDTDAFSCVEDVARTVLRAHRQYEGDILAFLPGEAEIRRCASLLDGQLGSTSVCPLYGMLPFEQQTRAIAPSKEGERKVVLATSIAETSLTIEGVRVVIDSGLYRTQVYDPANGQSHLETVPVSRDMAEQRAGRAGRVAQGTCIRLYRESTALRMRECRTPEILEADLLPLALDLAVWGSEDIPWLTPPPSWKLSQCRQVLKGLGALDGTGSITATGRRMASYPCHPRLARMLDSVAGSPVDAALAADLAAIVEDRDPLSTEEYGTDMDKRVSMLREARRKGNPGRWQRTIKASEQYRRLVHAAEDNSDPDWYDEGRILSLAYPERVGKLSKDGCGRFSLASGDAVFVKDNDEMAVSEWIVAVSANVAGGTDGRVFLSARIRQEDVIPMCKVQDKLAWNSKEGCIIAAREWRLGHLLADSRPVSDYPRDRVVSTICEAARKQGSSMLDFSDSVGNLQRRVAAVAVWHPELGLPDISTNAVLERAEEWLPLYIGKASTVAELKKIDLEQALWGLLDYDQQQYVERLAPSHITVPTGSRIRLEYRQGAEAPVLRVRLQECFGLVDTPRVDNGIRPVLMELLSPGYKPVQLTQDLASFWNGTYFEVRKELRRRYPKHSWPDNPLEAVAVRGVKKSF